LLYSATFWTFVVGVVQLPESPLKGGWKMIYWIPTITVFLINIAVGLFYFNSKLEPYFSLTNGVMLSLAFCCIIIFSDKTRLQKVFILIMIAFACLFAGQIYNLTSTNRQFIVPAIFVIPAVALVTIALDVGFPGKIDLTKKANEKKENQSESNPKIN
jgi:hypothetical protein